MIQSYTRDQLGTGPKNPSPGGSHFKRQSDVLLNASYLDSQGRVSSGIHRNASHLTVWIHREESHQTWTSNFCILSDLDSQDRISSQAQCMHTYCMKVRAMLSLSSLWLDTRARELLGADSPAGVCRSATLVTSGERALH